MAQDSEGYDIINIITKSIQDIFLDKNNGKITTRYEFITYAIDNYIQLFPTESRNEAQVVHSITLITEGIVRNIPVRSICSYLLNEMTPSRMINYWSHD